MSEGAASFQQIEQDLQRYPVSVTEEFRHACHALESELAQADLLRWGQTGVALAQHTVRAWEATTEYFRVSPRMLKTLPFPRFLQWANLGITLSDASPSLAAAYFRNSPGVVARLALPQMEQWAEQGLQLYRGTWKSSSLATKFFEVTPGLLEYLKFSELRQFATVIEALSQKSYDLASECVVLSPQVFSRLSGDRDAFLSLASALVETNWRETRSYFEASGIALPRIERAQRLRYLNLVEYLVRGGMTSVATFLNETSEALAQLEPSAHSRILALAENLLLHHPAAVEEFLRHAPRVLTRVSLNRLSTWFNEGVRALAENSEAGLAYFRVESTRAEEMLDALSSGVELGRIREVLRMYCRALSGTPIEILPTQDLVRKSIGWATENAATTEGTHVFLPEVVDRYAGKDSNFQWFKVVSTHQVAHLEFSSFDFQFDRPSSLFRDLRAKLASTGVSKADDLWSKMPESGAASSAVAPGVEGSWLTDMEHFFDLFRDRKLALDVFTVVEDSRIDARVQHEYPGLRQAYQQIQRDTLADRPVIEDLPARQALVEFLIRLSLQQYHRLPVPQQYIKEARAIARVIRRLLVPEATVEDTAEAALRIYGIISRLPNEEIEENQWENLNLDESQDDLSDEELEDLLNELNSQAVMDPTAQPPDEMPYQSPTDVEYRGDFKPELTQMMNRLRETQQERLQDPTVGEQVTREMLEQMLRKNVEMQMVHGEIVNTSGLYANNLMREAGLPPSEPYYGYAPHQHVDDEGGPLETTDPQTYLYDEWDFRANDYKPRWCIVRERGMEEGDPQFYQDTLQDYASLVSKVRRQFELLIPEMFRKVRRLPDGEEFDLDAAIEAKVDLRTGNSPSEKLFWRRNKVGREVAVAFLLDMSASTAEAIDEAKHDRSMQDAPEDPVEYMLWLRMRRGEGMRRSFKRIIDLEKESITLLIEALETTGDVYGIYGFSGYGRENVEFYVIKDILEQFSPQVINRIDKIAPLHATRMGPAIRHTVRKLDQVDARTKLLFLISDGRPQDRGYSREGVEKEYAVHDTRMALREARRRDIIPFCLTVDKQGHDYLKTMCQDMGYEVLADINALPERLPMLYRKLTI